MGGGGSSPPPSGPMLPPPTMLDPAVRAARRRARQKAAGRYGWRRSIGTSPTGAKPGPASSPSLIGGGKTNIGQGA